MGIRYTVEPRPNPADLEIIKEIRLQSKCIFCPLNISFVVGHFKFPSVKENKKKKRILQDSSTLLASNENAVSFNPSLDLERKVDDDDDDADADEAWNKMLE